MNEVSISAADVEPPPYFARIVPYCQRLLISMGVDAWEVSVVLCSDCFIRNLNRKHRSEDQATDVLSFGQGSADGAGTPFFFDAEQAPPDAPQRVGDHGQAMRPGGMFVAGDVVISVETARCNAISQRSPVKEEIGRLLIHGFLHLFGMGHGDQCGADLMLGRQERILKEVSKEKIL